MSWKLYRLIYSPEGPVHIGYHKLGFIQRTRYYIPARNIWGAITSNLTKAIHQAPNRDDYSNMGNEVSENVLISYFYPTFNEDGSNPIIPRYTCTGIRYGSFSEDQFERIFIRSFVQTAIEPLSMTAEDGSLHETEFIMPNVKYHREARPIYYVGYILIKDEWRKKDECLDVLDEISVGGERRYGFGRLKCIEKSIPEENKLFSCKLEYKDSDPLLIIPKGEPIPAHLVADPELKIQGDLEPLVGWDYVNDTYQLRQYHEEKLFWMPGSIPQQKLMLRIDRYGILKR